MRKLIKIIGAKLITFFGKRKKAIKIVGAKKISFTTFPIYKVFITHYFSPLETVHYFATLDISSTYHYFATLDTA
jgi:hypothetical protein